MTNGTIPSPPQLFYAKGKKIISNPVYGQVGHNGTIWNYSVLSAASSRQETEISCENGYYLYPITVTNALNHSTSFQIYGFNGVGLDGFQKQRGLLRAVINPNGTETRYEYDPFGRLHAVFDQL